MKDKIKHRCILADIATLWRNEKVNNSQNNFIARLPKQKFTDLSRQNIILNTKEQVEFGSKQ